MRTRSGTLSDSGSEGSFYQEEEGERIQPLSPTNPNPAEEVKEEETQNPSREESDSDSDSENMSPEVFVLNPFEGNVNPGSSNGQKLYLAATQFDLKESERTVVTIENGREVLDLFSELSSKFGWSPLITGIEIDIEGTKETLDLLTHYKILTLESMQEHALKYYSAETLTSVPTPLKTTDIDPSTTDGHKVYFYQRVRSKMISKAIEAHIAKKSFKALLLEKADFCWKDPNGTLNHDGPTMLWKVLRSCHPDTVVGFEDNKNIIEQATLAKYNNNVIDMLTDMQENFDYIIANRGSHDDFLRHIYKALLSGQNAVFNAFIQREKDKWHIGKGLKVGELVACAKQKYNNMKGEWTRPDPKDAKITALTTEVNKLKESYGQSSKSSTGTDGGASTAGASTSSDKDTIPGTMNLERWRTVKKEQTITRDGKTWHWCPHHKLKDKFDGLYMPHKPEDHDVWKKKKDERRAEAKANKSDGGGSSGNGGDTSNRRMQLSEKMRAALATIGPVSDFKLNEILDLSNQDF